MASTRRSRTSKENPTTPEHELPRLILEAREVPATAFVIDAPEWSGVSFVSINPADALASLRRAVVLRYKGKARVRVKIDEKCFMCPRTDHNHNLSGGPSVWDK